MEETLQLEQVKNQKPKKKIRLTKRAREIIFVCLMLFFPILQFVIFWIIPNFNSILMGFQNSQGDFTLNNFTKFWNEFTKEGGELSYALKNSLISAGVNIFISTPLVVFFSYVLFKRVPLSGAFRVIFYLPSIIGTTITATLYHSLLVKGAPVYDLLYKIGWISPEADILGLFSYDGTAFLMIIIYNLWTCVGLNMILFHGAMKRIPPEIFESAEIDGVGFFSQFVNIVVPLIWPTIATLIVFSLSGMFISYGAVMILTPGTKEASMIGWYIVKFTTATDVQASLTYPAAVGLIFTAVGLPFVLFIRFLLNKIGKDVEY